MWIAKHKNDDIVEFVEQMFYTRFAKTLIGARVGAKIKCGGIECDIDDVTHYQDKPSAPEPLTHPENATN